MITRRSLLLAALSATLVATGCKREAPADKAAAGDRPVDPAAEKPTATGELSVFAAASLREAFTTLGKTFETAHPGAHVAFNFAGTQELRTQLEHGADVDVFAAADTKHMDALVTAAAVATPVEFARNEPVVVVPAAQAATVKTFADLPTAKRLVIGTPEVPIGRYTDKILDNVAAKTPDLAAAIRANVVSRELNVKQVLAKVTLGEADAGIVYRTDAGPVSDKVAVITIPDDVNVIAHYPIAVTAKPRSAELAKAFVALVTSPEGQAVLAKQGFLPPAGVASAP